MNAAATTLRNGIRDIRWHIETLDIEWKLVASRGNSPPASPDEVWAKALRQYVGKGVAKRLLDYKCIIISLYGLLEQYIEGLVREYISNLNNVIPQYSDFPEPIKNSHVQMTMALLHRADQSRYKGTVKAETLIAELHSCLSNAKLFRVNGDAFAHHSANCRAEIIDNMLPLVGISNISQKIRVFKPFSEYLASIFPGRDPAHMAPQEMFSVLNDLAERRNEVAHGEPCETLSNQLMKDYALFVESYCLALNEMVWCHFAQFLIKHRGTVLGKPLKVFNNSIVCLEMKQCEIKLGDLLIATTGDPLQPYMIGEIEELQVDGMVQQIVRALPSVKIGARVSYKAKPNYDYTLVEKN